MWEDLMTKKRILGLECTIPDQAFNQNMTQIWSKKWATIEDGLMPLISLDGTYVFITLYKKGIKVK